MNKFSVIFKLSFINTIFFLSTRSRKQFSRRLRKHSRRDPIEIRTVHRKYLSSYCNAVGYELLDSANRRYGRRLDIYIQCRQNKRVQTDPQPSPWMNDYGQFSLMPVTGGVVFEQNQRASWFSHKAEIAKPYYYKVYLADHDVTTEMTVTERSSLFRFTFPEEQNSYVIVDAFDKGSYIKNHTRRE